jgi:hypothetical protein
MSLTDIASDVFLSLPFSLYSSISIFIVLIESDFMLLGMSIKGIDALIPDALGSFSFTRISIFEEIAFSAAIAVAPKRRETDVVAIKVNFLPFIRGRLHKQH